MIVGEWSATSEVIQVGTERICVGKVLGSG